MLLALMMVVGLLPMAALADSVDNCTTENCGHVAAIGTTHYSTLQEAVDAAGDEATVKLLDNLTEDVTIGSGKNIVLDLGGKTLTNTNAGKATLSVAGTATVKNGTITGGTSYYNIAVGTEAVPGGNLTLVGITATAGNDGSSMIDNWGTLTIESGNYTDGLNVVKSEEGSKLTINGGTFTLDYAIKWKFNAAILVYGETLITDGTFINNAKVASAYPQVVMTGVVDGYTAITRITGGTFTNNFNGTNSGIFRALGKATSDNFEISGGTFNRNVSASYFAAGYACEKEGSTYVTKSAVTSVSLDKTELNLKVKQSEQLIATVGPDTAEIKTVTWGTSDKKVATVSNGLVKAVGTGVATITATPVGDSNAAVTCTVTVIADVDVKEGQTDTKVGAGIDAEKVENLADSTVSGTGVTSVAKKVADQIAVPATKEDYVQAAGDGVQAPGDDAHITTVVAPRLDIEVKAYDEDGKSLTLGIEIVYDLEATTATGDEKLVRLNEDGTNASSVNTVMLQKKAGTLDTTGKSVNVTIYLPDGFAAKNDSIYVTHTKDNGNTYGHKVSVKQDGNNRLYVTFTNRNGFSTFTLTKEAVASIKVSSSNTVYYATLQEAVDAVQDGQTITLRKDAGEATVSRTVKFTVAPSTYSYTINLGANCTNASETAHEYDITYTAPVIPAYTVTVNAAENGTVTSNRRTATRGQTVTLTVAPEAGCQLDTLTVTDRSGNAVELTDKGNGTYTFKMPASKVTVAATFKKAPVFTDAGENNWYTAAILWAAEKGVALDEDGSGLFRPMDNCTRADMVTFLWRVAGCPEPTVENPFTDVKESDPWYKAVLWAYETGVTRGYGSKDMFAPDAVSSRAQTMLFLQRAVKGVDAAGDSFTDVPAGYYYEGAVYWALQNEVTKGYGDSKVFGPEYDCNRAEIITFIYRLYNK